MLINRKVDYALRVLSFLAATDGMVTTSQLSKKLKISKLFLAKIINELANKGVVGSKKGRSGGIVLKDPKTSVKRVILMFDPDISLNRCLKKGGKCFLDRQCLMHKMLEEAQNDLFMKLDSVSLENIALKGR